MMKLMSGEILIWAYVKLLLYTNHILHPLLFLRVALAFKAFKSIIATKVICQLGTQHHHHHCMSLANVTAYPSHQ